jgi:broad-specificity NMP kinase
MEIIHITGPSGSGKSHLEQRIKDEFDNDIVILDTDKIDDMHALELLKNDKIRKEIIGDNINYFFNKKDKLNKQYLDKFIKNNKSKPIIIIGMSFGQLPRTYADHKFCIKIDPEVLYKRIYLRTLKEICTHNEKIEQLLKSKEHPEIIKALMVHKFHLRQDFIGSYSPLVNHVKRFYEEQKKDKYKIITSDEILKAIQKIIK